MRKLLKGIGNAVGALLGGVYLVILYVFTIWIAVGSLSAIQVRDDFQNEDQAFTFASVQRAQDRYAKAVERIYREAERDDLVNQKVYDIEQNMLQVATWLGYDQAGLDIWAYALTPEFASVQIGCKIGDAAAAPPDAVCNLLGRHDALLVQLEELKAAGADAQFIEADATVQQKIDELAANEPMYRYFETYAFFSSMNYGSFLHVPPQVLVLLLTIAMGMLGSVVTMTWLFIRQDSGLTLRRFIILPFIGSMSAFIILIFVSAGQLTLTAGDASDQLNPFVLSFVGIISGLLSERAYTRIADVGGNFFKVDDGQPRWGLALDDALDAAGVTPAELALHLGTTEEEAGRIVGESTTATLQQQRLIAACLRRNVRELFTDVPPDGPAAQAAGTPDLTGLDLAAARAALHAAGLELGARAEAPDAAAAPGAVIAQSPPPLARAARGARIDVTLASAAPSPPDPNGPPDSPGVSDSVS